MKLFNWIRKKKETKPEEPSAEAGMSTPETGAEQTAETEDTTAGWDESGSLSLGLSKVTVPETTADPEEERIPVRPYTAAISNEQITKDTLLLDTYQVVSDEVRGGMGSVWKVHHNGWNTDLAMKRPQPKYFAEAGEGRKENFIHECEAWINLGLHPNIVSCYYVREIGGVPTIFSEWMENGSLRDRIDDGSLYEGTPEEVRRRLLNIAAESARGLHYAHESEGHLIHQDVKPDNLLLTKDWHAKVADFGLARARTRLVDDNSEKTESGSPGEPGTGVSDQYAAAAGCTPAYCSYEQILRRPLTGSTDIYSWAVSVMEMYLGKRPWKRGTEAGENRKKYYALCRIAMPESLKALLSKCLASDPEERPRDFAEVEKALEEIYRGTTGTSFPEETVKAAADTAASLNNRALSYIDLGRYKEAERLLEQAVNKDSSLFLYHYNLALFRWNRKKISDRAFVSCLKDHEDKSMLCREKMAEISRMRGFFDEGKEEYSYSTYNRERPKSLEPLHPVSAVNYDRTLQAEGYIVKDKYRPDRYGYRVKDLCSGKITDVPNDYDDYGISAPRDGLTYIHGHYYKGSQVFFAGPHSELIVMPADVLWFFDAASGRLILSLPPIVDDDGDTFPYEVLGYTDSGIIEYKNWEQRWERWLVHAVRLFPETELPYALAGIATVNDRLEAEDNMEKYYMEAKACWEKGDVHGTCIALNKSLEDQVLAMHEPSLRLWSQLGAYYPRGTLVTVVPTSDDPTPVPQRYECLKDQALVMSEENKNRTDNGQTELILGRTEKEEFDSFNDMYEYTFYFGLTAKDKRSGELYFTVQNLEIAYEADWEPYSRDRYIVLQGDTRLWYAQEYAEERMIDLAEIHTERGKFKDGVSRLGFCLPGGYVLKNTAEGVDIGGFVFPDAFTDFRPLWNSDVIACRDHNYRLVYNYICEDSETDGSGSRND